MFEIAFDLILQFIQFAPVFIVVLSFCALVSGWLR